MRGHRRRLDAPAPLTKLRELGLRRTNVTDAGLINLRMLTNLRVLDLRETRITDSGLMHLKGLTSLQRLCLGGTKVSNAGAQELQQELRTVKILR